MVRLIRGLAAFQLRVYNRFQALPRRTKRLILAQWLVCLLAFGAVTKGVYHARGPGPPVEIPYSRFLDLVEQQEKGSADVPVMDQVRIGTDRIVYRLYPAEKKADATDKVAEKKAASRLLGRRAARSSRSKETKARDKKAPFVTAYTYKVPATSELVSTLRHSDVSFTAASRAKASTISLVLRTVGVAFYFMILWRLYSSISGATGANKKDVPGKLAQGSDLPMASFDEIEGIDDVKAEVMELVDTIRHPQKYAVLGARAPTGILLEGPSGTGLLLIRFSC